MSATVEDRIIYIRELVHNLIDCAQDTLSANGVEDAALEPVDDILSSLARAVDDEALSAGLLSAQPNPLFNELPYAPVLQLCRRKSYSNGTPVMGNDGRGAVWLNHPEHGPAKGRPRLEVVDGGGK